MVARFMQDHFFGAVLVLLSAGSVMGMLGIQVIAFYTTAVQVIGTGGGVSG